MLSFDRFDKKGTHWVNCSIPTTHRVMSSDNKEMNPPGRIFYINEKEPIGSVFKTIFMKISSSGGRLGRKNAISSKRRPKDYSKKTSPSGERLGLKEDVSSRQRPKDYSKKTSLSGRRSSTSGTRGSSNKAEAYNVEV